MNNRFFTRPRRWVCYAAAALLVACAQTDRKQDTHNPELWPRTQSPFDPAETARIDRKIDALLAQMSVEQKVGQMTQAEVNAVTPEQVKEYHLGSVFISGGGFLDNDKYASVEDWLTRMDALYDASVDTSDGHLAIPMTFGTDAVHGHNKVYGATVFPHNINLGATRNRDLVREVSALTAKQVRATGMDWTFSPQVSIARDIRWGRTFESYAEEPRLVADLGRESILGYQGDLNESTFMNPDRIVATAKHFIADGGTADGVDRGDNRSSNQELIDLHAPSYYAAVEAGALIIMASHSSWKGTRLHGERYLLTDILKGRMGFDGMIVGDWNSHGLVEGCTNDRCPQSVNAGVDMFMVPFEWREFIENTVEDVHNGEISMDRLDDAVRRILRTKFRAGLMDAPKPSERPLGGQEELLASQEMRDVSRQAVRESLVLLKNNENLLPLKPQQNVLVAGTGAHNIAQQTGGWTISWLATDLTNEDFPNGTSIYQGIEAAVSAAGGRVTLSEDGQYQQKPDVAIVVYGEEPYAEWLGDVSHLAFENRDNQHAQLLERLQADGIKTVSVFLSGRPMWVNRALNASDAFVAAWLPGTEGDGVAEVLFTNAEGQIDYDFHGRLPFTWPRTPMEADSNVGDEDYDPLFPFGYGLSYQKPAPTVGTLPVDSHLQDLMESQRAMLFDGSAREPWQMYLAAEGEGLARYTGTKLQRGALTLSPPDEKDGVLAQWDGSGTGSVQVNMPTASRNLNAARDLDGALVFDLRLLEPTDAQVLLGMACRGSANCRTDTDITRHVQAAQQGEWQTISAALECFAQEIDFVEIEKAFILETAGQLHAQLNNIQLKPGQAGNADIQCDPESSN